MKKIISLSLIFILIITLSSCEFLVELGNIIESSRIDPSEEFPSDIETIDIEEATDEEEYVSVEPTHKPASEVIKPYVDEYIPSYGRDVRYIKKGSSPIYEYWKGSLKKSNQISAYEQLVQMVKDKKCEIVLKEKISFSEMEFVYKLFRLDHPEFFWNGSNYHADGYENAISSFKVKPIYNDQNEISEKWKEVEKKIKDQYLSQIPENATDIEAELIIYSILTQNITYDTSSTDAYSIYGAIVKKRCCCEGFAEAFQYICNNLGIPTISITGIADNSVIRENHKWNGIQIGGKWYQIDPTWGASNSPCLFFNDSYYIDQSHTIDDVLYSAIPNFYSDEASYLDYYGLSFTESDFDEVFMRAVVHFTQSAKDKKDIIDVIIKAPDWISAEDYSDKIGDGSSKKIVDLLKIINNEFNTDYYIYDDAFVLCDNYISFKVLSR